jgi:hypothetical protein
VLDAADAVSRRSIEHSVVVPWAAVDSVDHVIAR